MSKSKGDIKYATSQARLDEDEAVRTAYKHGTPLEGGKIAESEPVDLFSSARNIPKAQPRDEDSSNDRSQMQQHKPDLTKREGGPGSAADSAKCPKKTPPAHSTK
ncbi:hypothetical protein FF1_035876 [Malus domestica]